MENNTIPKEIIKPLLNIGPSIQEHLDNLNELMIHWLTYDEPNWSDENIKSITNTYHSLKGVLTNLRPIEKENKNTI